MASIKSFSSCTCYEEILTEVEENGDGIEEIIDVLASGGESSGGDIGGGSEGESGQIQSPNYPDFYPPSSDEVFSALHIYDSHIHMLLGVEPGGCRRTEYKAHL